MIDFSFLKSIYISYEDRNRVPCQRLLHLLTEKKVLFLSLCSRPLKLSLVNTTTNLFNSYVIVTISLLLTRL